MTVRALHGDSRSVVPSLDEASVDACVTDPPYSLQTINKRFAKVGRTDKTWTSSGPHQRTARGFMNKTWDVGDTAFDPEFWAEVYRVLKPGAHLVAFGGTRTHHKLWSAIDDAGFEIRDTVMWLFGSGFPKSHNQPGGWGTALKPAFEPICLARKPLIGTVAANMAAHGTGALNIDGCRVEGGERPDIQPNRRLENGVYGAGLGGSKQVGRTNDGRWPANVVHDGSEEVLAAFARFGEGRGAAAPVRGTEPSGVVANVYGARERVPGAFHADTGSAARFFFSAKADADDRCDSKHPTVKPVSLMRWLCRLVTPPGGTVLDPFAGSGTTGVACIREGFDAVLVEREAEYVADIRRRLDRLAGLDSPLFAGGSR